MSDIGHGHAGVDARLADALAEDPEAPVPWAAATATGPLRTHNEDRWSVGGRRPVFALADGMGGSNAGEAAAQIAVRTVAESVCALHDARLDGGHALCRAVAAAQAGIVAFARTRPECLGMATTLVAALLEGDRLTVAHVGDSRAYLMRAGRLRRLTVDHAVGPPRREARRTSPAPRRRLPSSGILTRALGIESDPPRADVESLDWQRGDLLLLCTDGVSDTVDDATLAALLAPTGVGLGARARALVSAALERGCTDDATVLLAGGIGRAH